MSGGVDSAVAAAMLVEQGYECIGATMRLAPEAPASLSAETGEVPAGVKDARRICEALGIRHEVLHETERFEREIIANFIDEYRRGRTPNPCIRCNRLIKFGALYERADALGASCIATGHYARLERKGHRLALRRAVDSTKDQSYVLAPLTQAQLARAWFPLGGMAKLEVRRRAERFGLPIANQRESQDVCFVPDPSYGAFIERRVGAAEPGPIISVTGETIGRHRGLIHYTVGQRRGLGIGGADGPYYIAALDPANNALIVGHEEDTYCADFTTEALFWAGIPPQTEPVDCLVQLHSQHKPAPATLYLEPEGARIHLHDPQHSVTPGQWAVCYDGEYVLCAGIINSFTRLST